MEDDEVVMKKFVKLHRMNLKDELIKLFHQQDILTYELDIQMYNANGSLEEGSGIGVIRDCFCAFFEDFFISNATGRDEKVPTVRHDMGKEHWQSIARMLIYLLKRKVGYFPLSLSPAFLVASIFGEENVSDDYLLESFKNYVSLDEKDLLNSNSDFEDIKDDLITMLSDYDCKRLPTEDSLHSILVEIAHAELIQKPKYISNCFEGILQRFRLPPFDTVANLQQFFKQNVLSTKKVIKCLVISTSNKEEIETEGYLIRYLKTLNKENLALFVRFVTGSDMLPLKIEVEFTKQQPRMPRAQTCGSVLLLSSSYSCLNELSEEFSNILKCPEAFTFTNV